MVRSQVKVYVRTRPTAVAYDGLKIMPDGCSISVKVPKQEAGIINNQTDQFAFKLDGVLENVSQESLYTTAASEVVDSVIAGYSGCIFAYGQTGSGKTFTMAGDLRNYAHRGVIPRAISHIFKEMDMRVDKLYKVHVSYLEIYNEQMYDLLSENPGSSEALAVMEDSVTGTYVRGLTRVEIRSEEEALAAYFAGEQGRSTARHVLNAQSSRSHCIFTLHLEVRTSEAASERAVLARLHLVDLAGSERTKKTNAQGQTLKEAQFINRSLSYLEQVVGALARRDPHVPFRQSRLTSVLRDALGGNCKTVMIANIWGEPTHLEETVSTLRFASRVRQLTTELSMAESDDPALLLKKYERQVRELRQELAMRDALAGRARVSYEDLSDAELRDLHALCRRFMQDEADVEELPVDSLKKVKEAYKALRSVHQGLTSELTLQLSKAQATGAAGGVGGGEGEHAPGTAANTVGEVDGATRGFQVGQAPANARPPKGALAAPGSPGPKSPGAASIPAGTPRGALRVEVSGLDGIGVDGLSSAGAGGGAGAATDRNALFVRFKREVNDGLTLNAVVKEREAQLKDIKVAIKEVSAAVNASKAAIDDLTARLAAKRAETGGGLPGVRPGEEDVADAEGGALAQALKGAKQRYRADFDRLKDLRGALEPLAASVADAKRDLINEFDTWMARAGAATLMGVGGAGDEESELDAGEAFERMQLNRIAAVDPDSTAYHAAARKTLRASTNKSPVRSFGGAKAAAESVRRKEHEALINQGLVR